VILSSLYPVDCYSHECHYAVFNTFECCSVQWEFVELTFARMLWHQKQQEHKNVSCQFDAFAHPKEFSFCCRSCCCRKGQEREGKERAGKGRKGQERRAGKSRKGQERAEKGIKGSKGWKG